ncbi:cAMP-dependent protein kinase inhibitor beta isoform X4 [Zalophus californianus]|uniref:cAMP-dependent protein kinase inhibitor beta isoform X4 n=1 Tax=Zalophus californianus TaxID=9704 RepID=A0A6J2DQ30_ZALCA|nr:cAMP-dependent protein kinase inhibitor beta isoform X4 [Zalophus californianus]
MWDHGILKGTQTRELQGKLGTVKLLRPHRGQKDRGKKVYQNFFLNLLEITAYFNQRLPLGHGPRWMCTSILLRVRRAQATVAREATAQETSKM